MPFVWKFVQILAIRRPSFANNFTINIDNEIKQLYFDGILVQNLANAKVWNVPDSVPLPPGTEVIAVLGLDTGGSASMTASDSRGRVFADRTWRYSTVFESGWAKVDFDDRHWKRVTVAGFNDGSLTPWFHIRGVARHAAFIWSPGWSDTLSVPRDAKVYFRYRINQG